VGVTQVPLLQVPAATNCWPEQLADPQLEVGYEQSPLASPAQEPAQAVPPPRQAVRLPCGGPDWTGLQVPTLPALSQASHELVQARLQQMPSAVQIALLHSWAAPQVDPLLFLGRQLPLLQ
jgi:hypothetical protein